MPGKCYVYFHKDLSGQIFYVGMGRGKRAWSKDRHPIWKKYVNEYLNGQYEVEIHEEGLSEEDAEFLEMSLINEYGNLLVNWGNPGRDYDEEACFRANRLRDKSKALFNKAHVLEKTDIEGAIDMYREALAIMREAESIKVYDGLWGELIAGIFWGYPMILDRLTICLIKTGQIKEAIEEAQEYFADFPKVLELKIGLRIKARVDKQFQQLTQR